MWGQKVPWTTCDAQKRTTLRNTWGWYLKAAWDTQEPEQATQDRSLTETWTEIHTNHHHEGAERQYSSSLSEGGLARLLHNKSSTHADSGVGSRQALSLAAGSEPVFLMDSLTNSSKRKVDSFQTLSYFLSADIWEMLTWIQWSLNIYLLSLNKIRKWNSIKNNKHELMEEFHFNLRFIWTWM